MSREASASDPGLVGLIEWYAGVTGYAVGRCAHCGVTYATSTHHGITSACVWCSDAGGQAPQPAAPWVGMFRS